MTLLNPGSELFRLVFNKRKRGRVKGDGAEWERENKNGK